MTVLIVGNCQVVGLRELVTAACPDLEVEVWNKTAEELVALERQMESCDTLVSQPYYSPKYAGLTRACQSRPAGRQTEIIHNLYWNVSTPDCRYVGQPAMNSPVMNYHSGKVLDCFLAGESEAQAVAAFGRYDKAGAEAAWSAGVQALREREENVTVPFSDELVEVVKHENCFHVPNHPTIGLMKIYAGKILERLFGGVTLPEATPGDRLAQLGAFPAYRSISTHLSLPYASDVFLVKTPNGLAPMSVEDFVGGSYRIYANARRESLA